MIKRLLIKLLSIAIVISVVYSCGMQENQPAQTAEIIPLAYNRPGLVADLGVGLWAWPLAMDYDRDGDMDLLVSCPDKPYNGCYFFENREGKRAGLPVFEPPVRIGPGLKHLQVSYVNGEPRITGRGIEYLSFRDSLFGSPKTLFPAEQVEKQYKLRFSQWKFVDYEGDGDDDLIVGLDDWEDYGWDNAFNADGIWRNGPLHGYVYLLENVKGQFHNRGKIKAAGRAVDVYGAPSPNMMDFDLDGDLDLICGEFLDRFTWYENLGTRTDPVFSEGRYLENEEGIIRMDLEMIVPSAVDFDNDGDADLVVGDEDGRVAWLENTGRVEDHMPVFHSPVYIQQKAHLVKFGALVTPFAVDWDADGDEDLICGNTAGYIGFIENLDGGDPPAWNTPEYLKADGKIIRIMAGSNGSIQGPAEQKWGYTTLSVADWDGDGLHDLIVNSIWGRIIWYKNNGRKGEPSLTGPYPIKAVFKGNPPSPAWNWWVPQNDELVTQWRTTPYAVDWNGDGLTDLLMLDPEGYLSYYERFSEHRKLKLKPGSRIFYGENHSQFDHRNQVVDSIGGPLRLNAGDAGSSGRRKFCFSDWDGDGDLDLLVNSLNVSLLENTGTRNGFTYFMDRGELLADTLAGHTTSPTMVDWNRDHIPDLLIGAEDGHFYYYRRTGMHKSSNR